MEKVFMFGILLVSSMSFGQSATLRAGEQATVSCSQGSSLDVVSRSSRQVTVGCYKACTFTLKTKESWSGSRYCYETIFPSGTIADTCGSPKTSRDSVIDDARAEADQRIATGTCDKAIFTNF